MNILLAESDRDFVSAFERLLQTEHHTVRTAFDGTQAVTKLTESRCDMVILGEELPRISYQEIIRLLNNSNTPVVVISYRKINTGVLTKENLASSYLTLPFLPQELLALIDSIAEKRQSGERIEYHDVSFDLSDFKLCGSLRVTNEEIDIFHSLMHNQELDSKRAGPYINALNEKLEKLKKQPRIRYRMQQGYRLVMNDHE